ncbi:hypothetical protein [Flavobacterium lacus]|uniref:DltD-like protein n=1 Tax=Flavobacterium lacus TaxID=1353778 RepID=A0A328WY40_9FLAO|nr:hypothetical protein [Flavobacterium lacus]RAR51143.1 hypothetical protein B0I10_101319 [Flavobacterium lacus]
MKVFSLKLIIFFLPIVVVAVGLEIYFRNVENAFKIKADFQQQNIDKIETLVLGTSHSQNGINPKYFDNLTSNLSFGSQDIQLDSALFFNYIDKMKSLKNIIIELDYHRLDIENDKNYFRLPWYYMYHQVQVYPIKLIKKFSLYSSNISFFNQNLINALKGTSKKQKINEFGFVEENYIDDFLPLKYDSTLIFRNSPERLKNRHQEDSETIRISNKKRLDFMIDYAIKKRFTVYIVSTPLYKTYRDHKLVLKDSYRKKYIDSLITHSKIRYVNLEDSPLFIVKDFSNDDHLNATGAKKYSSLLNEAINSN